MYPILFFNPGLLARLGAKGITKVLSADTI